MGKVTSLYGKTTGKIGSIVFATSGGETIAREYNPHVANPSTTAQVNQRARLKLMSQLSASLANVIAMTKDGLVSRRNKFVKKNMDACYASDGQAQISYENVQLTEGSIGLPTINVQVSQVVEGTVSLGFASAPSPNIARIVYCIFEKSEESKIALVESVIATNSARSGAGNFYFNVDLTNLSVTEDTGGYKLSKEYVFYAYGMIDTSEKATARYGNLNVQSASDIATLVATRTISFEDYQFTQTRGTTAGQGSQGGGSVPAGQARVFVTALGNGGTVSGGGTFAIGSTVQISATPANGYVFSRWIKNGTSQTVSTANPYSFTLNEQTDLVAVFDADGGGGL